MTLPWLSIVGLHKDGVTGLGSAARAQIDAAEVLIGGARHLAMLPENATSGCERVVWPRPLGDPAALLVRYQHRPTCVLASGDPLCFGIGASLVDAFGADALRIVPAPSAFSLARARLGWRHDEVDALSLHGRPLTLLNAYIQPGAKLLTLTADGTTPAQVARQLCERGYRASHLTVLERLGGPAERQHDGSAADWASAQPAFDPLNTLAICCVADPGTRPLARVPGLPDDAFQHDGQLTKSEVRAITLARLAPLPGQLLWDVGAGCGSIGIEWLRAARSTRAIAVEQNADRRALCAANAAALGAPQLELCAGKAPSALLHLAPPDAAFIGGGLSDSTTLSYCWERLQPGGRLVANAVTVEGEVRLADWQQRLGGELTRLSVARATPVGRFLGWRPLLPVTQWYLHKEN